MSIATFFNKLLFSPQKETPVMKVEKPIVKKTLDISFLEEYLPAGCLPLIRPLLAGYSVIIKVKPPRKSKFGDYRPLRNAKYDHQITLNNDLNPYAFAVTLLHEIAHMYTYVQHKGKVKPHGNVWKEHYSVLLYHVIQAGIFPTDIEKSLIAHLKGPTASSCSDHTLFHALKLYDQMDTHLILLQNLGDGEHFKWRNGMVFKKAEKLRKRYRCIDMKSKRVWLFHPMAEVERLDI
ncbi:MAG: sprT domain-containing protein [Sphingobacteriales bacterium]|nr:MAG: sprT domain-containing protein [Sphingobacteriales bacterium]